jgi:hypothetical protein
MKGKVSGCTGSKINVRTGGPVEIKVTGHEIRVHMRQDNIVECQMMMVEIKEIMVDVALWIHDSGDEAFFISKQVGGLG